MNHAVRPRGSSSGGFIGSHLSASNPKDICIVCCISTDVTTSYFVAIFRLCASSSGISLYLWNSLNSSKAWKIKESTQKTRGGAIVATSESVRALRAGREIIGEENVNSLSESPDGEKLHARPVPEIRGTLENLLEESTLHNIQSNSAITSSEWPG